MSTEPSQPTLPAPRPAKPRLLQDGRDMFWSIAPLVLACIVLAGLAGTCSFRPGGMSAGPVPSYDAVAALNADAQTLGFPVRLPQLPEGWQPNSGSRDSITDGRSDPSGQRLRAVTSRVGYISPTGMYVSLTQSNADEAALVTAIHPGLHPTGTEDVDGTRWVVYQGDGEPVWTTRLAGTGGSAQLAITGAAGAEQFRVLAAATQSQPPLPTSR
ncbi:DUF4245 domain-containing protein [Mycolicibacter terrae]|uniref:DUF4245 domain-containing protein n=2 Tax=Mycolicibacter TaxID=1073531 RepID=A0A1A2P278_MYCSD|nr:MULTISPECIES: DUF4245 domain-containing protein [Mycolicibacter]OBH21432.1 hypothetical protein A5694_13235 [Mycolicibacter sinensis]OBI26249.1 hypothetical protein A5710_07395 [Mycolicibacter sinensis]RRR47286.1 DUF4245 domain-containing protein [Mycolicibacter terrae]